MLLRRLLAVTAVLLAFTASASACSRDDRAGDGRDGGTGSTTSPTDPSAGTAAPSTTTTTAAPALDLVFVGLDPNGTAPPDDATLANVQATLRGYFATAIVAPLRSGGPASDLSPFFTPVALERVAGPDRPTMVEEGLPPASRSITGEVTNVALGTVAGPDEVTAVVTARIDLRLHAVGPALDVDIVRQGELVLVLDGETWKIDGFQVRTSRDSRP